jgi:hypothetical protein
VAHEDAKLGEVVEMVVILWVGSTRLQDRVKWFRWWYFFGFRIRPLATQRRAWLPGLLDRAWHRIADHWRRTPTSIAFRPSACVPRSCQLSAGPSLPLPINGTLSYPQTARISHLRMARISQGRATVIPNERPSVPPRVYPGREVHDRQRISLHD